MSAAKRKQSDNPIGARSSILVGGAGTWAAIVSAIIIVIQGNILSPAASTDFQVFWGLLFAVYGTLDGARLEATRGVTNSVTMDPAVLADKPRMSRMALLLAGVVLVIGFGSMALWHGELNGASGANSWVLASAVVIGAMGYSIHTVLVGVLTGLHKWRMTAFVVATEGTVRLGLVLAVFALVVRLEWLAWGSALSTLGAIVILALSPDARHALESRSDVHARTLLRRIPSAAAGQGSNALLVAGFSFLAGLTMSDAEKAPEATPISAALFLAVQLTRAPLLVPLTALQGIAVTHFTQRRHEGVRAAVPVLAAATGIGLIGVFLAWLVGPWVFQLVSTKYEMSGGELAGLTLGATMIAILTLTGVLCQSAARYQWYLAGWFTALVVAFGILLTPQSLDARVPQALVIGPIVGAIVHLVGLRRRGDAPATALTGDFETRALNHREKPTVSVCMAAYNGAEFIEEQLRSILEQLGPHDEVTVVDDASKDNTVTVIEAVGDPRIRVVRRDVNQGYVQGFAEAMSRAQGEFIFLSDQDDVWRPGRVATMVEALRTAKVVASNVGVLGSDGGMEGPYGQADWRLRAADSRHHLRNILAVLAGNRPYQGCAMAVRRDALPGILPIPAYFYESHDLWIGVYGNLARSITHLEFRSLDRRFHADNWTSPRPRWVMTAVKSRARLVRATIQLAGRTMAQRGTGEAVETARVPGLD